MDDKDYALIVGGISTVFAVIGWIIEGLVIAFLFFVSISGSLLGIYNTFIKDKIKGPNFKIIEGFVREMYDIYWMSNTVQSTDERTYETQGNVLVNFSVLNIGDIVGRLVITEAKLDIEDYKGNSLRFETFRQGNKPVYDARIDPNQEIPSGVTFEKPVHTNYPISGDLKLNGYFFDHKGEKKLFEKVLTIDFRI